MTCQCPVPQQHVNPRYRACARCLKVLDPAIVSDTAKLQAFLDRVPGVSPRLAAECRDREKAGRTEFGLRYLARDNIGEFRQEIADGVNYLFFESLKDRRAGLEENVELIRAAHKLSEAYAILERYR